MSTGLSANLPQKSTGDLLALQAKLLEYKRLQGTLTDLSRHEFRDRYPTPGALAKAYHRSTRQTPALDAIDAALVELADGEGASGRQMIFVPPQEGKSTRTSCWFPLWMLAQDPSLRIAIVSYSQTKAERWGRWIRRMIVEHPELGITLTEDNKAVSHFTTTAGGSVLSVGIGGGITGEPVDLMVIDDPVRGRAEAESPTYREAAWGWWESNGSTRLSSRGRVVLMLTRWHADDLAGRLLREESGEWKTLRIPAVLDSATAVVRGSDGASAHSPDGELISVQNRAPGYFLALQAKRSRYVWNSIYMQTPVAAEGNLFDRADFRYWQYMKPDASHHDPLRGAQLNIEGTRYFIADMTRFITVDLAASKKTSADWTVAAVWGITGNGKLILLDRNRAQVGKGDHWDLVRPLVTRWACPDVYVEESFISATFVRDATASGLRIQPVTPDTDKITRSLAAQGRIRSHTVYWPDYVGWQDEWEDEIAGFPAWGKDDQADTFFYASRIASAHWHNPLRTEAVKPYHPAEDEVAYQASTGLTGQLDLSRADW